MSVVSQLGASIEISTTSRCNSRFVHAPDRLLLIVVSSLFAKKGQKNTGPVWSGQNKRIKISAFEYADLSAGFIIPHGMGKCLEKSEKFSEKIQISE